jgi:hypothetical protein
MISAHAGMFAMVAAIGAAFGAAAVAAEVPADTNEIKCLTPAQARAVVRHAVPDDMRRRFPHLTEFEISTIISNNEIVKYDESSAVLRLNGLTALDHETAKELAPFKGRLQLNGLATLDRQTAKVLSEGKCSELQCDGLEALTCEAARALARAKIRACQLPLTEIDLATAKEISQFRGRALSLPRLATLNADAAKALAGWFFRDFSGGVAAV